MVVSPACMMREGGSGRNKGHAVCYMGCLYRQRQGEEEDEDRHIDVQRGIMSAFGMDMNMSVWGNTSLTGTESLFLQQTSTVCTACLG